MNSSPFTRGGDLLRARGRDQLLPSWGQKEVEPSGSWLEEKQIDARLRDRQMLLEEPKFARRDTMACGEWLAESRMVRIVHEAGDFWQHMGAETDIGKCLYPEESIYLMETGELEVTYGGMPLSIQQAQTLMLQDAHQMDKYIVYAHLTRNGCKVIRHQPHLMFTRYEKVIRLDQHQATRKTAKLQLKDKTNKVETKEDIKCDSSNREGMDDALAEFYASLDGATSDSSEAKDDNQGIDKVSHNENATSQKKRGRTNSSEHNEYEHKRRTFLGLFPNVVGKSIMNVLVESSELLPANSMPIKDSYEISLEALNYYSKYDDTSHESDRFYNSSSRHNERGNRLYHQSRREDDWRYGRDNSRWNRDRSTSQGRRDWSSNQRHNGNGNDWHTDSSGIPMAWRDSPDYHQSKRNRDWHQHDDRWSYDTSQYDDSWSHNMSQEDEYTNRNSGQSGHRDNVDMSIRPRWKIGKRRKQKYQKDYYPSCLVKLNVKVDSWSEYKRILKETSAEKLLLGGPGRVLWKGRTVPLIKPGMAASTQSVLAACSMGPETTNVNDRLWKIPTDLQLAFHFDVYLPNVPYRKSQPSQPSKRITVLRFT
ncbi:uncharacterized protein LOC122258885 isoform X2 [Penaeus japonicus]|uniref:uncharacterized protein LOC122258885 isoform X2 n=1 Tax=Penaeus japonicus TaxID=27405 RepID=UPI001C70CEC1|nr:uncharacterized protein LOC122258885 isoform X2 [Penaeus japonicus]